MRCLAAAGVMGAGTLFPVRAEQSGLISFRADERNGDAYWALENRYIRIEVMPEASGRFSGYIYKPGGFNQFLEYARGGESAVPLLIAAGYDAGHNCGGFCDQRWEDGYQRNEEIPYEIERLGDRGIRVRRPGGQVVRDVLLEDPDGTEATVRVRVNNTGDGPYSYWAHGLVHVGGDFREIPTEAPDDYEIIPLTPTLPEAPRLKESWVRSHIVRPDTETIRDEVVLLDDTAVYSPAQPWCAVADRNQSVILGMVVEPAEILEEGLILHRWTHRSMGESRMSQEFIFPAVPPGGEREFVFRFVTLSGLHRLSYLNREMGIALDGVAVAPEKGYFQILAAPTRKIGNARITIELVGEKKRAVAAEFQTGPLAPGSVWTQRVSWPGTLSEGTYAVHGMLRTDRLEDRFRFLGESATVPKQPDKGP